MYAETEMHAAEPQLLQQALEAVTRETGLRLTIGQHELRIDGRVIDATVCINEQNECLPVEVKRWAQHANLGAVIAQVKALPGRGILVADYVNPNMANKLRENDVQFLDAAGNAFIDIPPVYVLVTGRRRPKEEARLGKEEANRAFDRTGLKVVFAFLCRPQLIAAPYREIAAAAGVAQGTVGWVINGLKGAGFVFDPGGKEPRQLLDYRRLLDRWVEAYPQKLRPKQHIGDFYADRPDWWDKLDIQEFHGYWGGEVAAEAYTQYLTAKVATVYMPKAAHAKFMAKARLQKPAKWAPEEGANVRIYQPFWRNETIPFLDLADPGLVPPVLAYADLVATADPRNLEAARMIYEQRIARFDRQD